MFLIMAQRSTATRVAGYRTWQKLGRQVKHGEKGIVILAPVIYRKKTPVNDENKDKDEQDEILATFKAAHIFDVSQTEGKALPELARVVGDPVEFLSRLKDFIAHKGITLQYSATLGSAEGLCAGQTIILKEGLPLGEEFSVLAHETGHSLLHQDGAKRDRKVRELEAEAVACVVCEAVGLDATASSNDYIQLYQGNRDMLMASLERIQKIAAEIIEGVMNSSVEETVVEMSQSETVEPVVPMAA